MCCCWRLLIGWRESKRWRRVARAKEFSSASNLTSHLRTHNKERPYRCTESGCRKAFKWRSSLAHHKDLHSRKSPARSVSRSPKARAERSEGSDDEWTKKFLRDSENLRDCSEVWSGLNEIPQVASKDPHTSSSFAPVSRHESDNTPQKPSGPSRSK
mmetsp:Transcript_24477/g.64506  ORF Transcript_24477/g.64506 Transcript_24477/m.64506 type:complete len:157 (-) Transcript_24477:40-510(-)